MAARKRYFVQLDNQRMIRVSAGRWHQWIAVGVLILVAGRVAKPAKEGVIRIGENGEPHFPQDPTAPWMNLNCRVIERHAIYDTRGPKLDPVKLQRAIQKAYAGRD
jgi:hypothetical protein